MLPQFIKYTGVLMFLFTLTACQKYLDVKSNSNRITPNTLESLQSLLDDSYTMNFFCNTYGEASADNYFITQNVYNSLAESWKRVYTWSNFIYTYNNDWAGSYLPVYNCNLVLESINKITGNIADEEQRNQVKGSALFYRAHQFLWLVWTYGNAYDSTTAANDLGIVLRTTADPTVPSKRASVEESYRMIIADLRAGIGLLPLHPDHVMRPSKPAAWGLLARTYLSMRKYDSAYYYAEQALNVHSQLLDFNIADEVNISGGTPFRRFNKETIFYAQLANSHVTISPFTALIDTVLHASYEDGDLRKSAYFAPAQQNYVRFKGTYTESSNNLFSGIATDELYLIKAECLARLGDISTALETLNTLLATRWEAGSFVSLEAGSQDEAVDVILRERNKELVMRGLRWIDVKRLNKEGRDIVLRRFIDGQLITLSPNDNRYALPLPDDIVRQTGMPQNDK